MLDIKISICIVMKPLDGDGQLVNYRGQAYRIIAIKDGQVYQGEHDDHHHNYVIR